MTQIPKIISSFKSQAKSISPEYRPNVKYESVITNVDKDICLNQRISCEKVSADNNIVSNGIGTDQNITQS